MSQKKGQVCKNEAKIALFDSFSEKFVVALFGLTTVVKIKCLFAVPVIITALQSEE